MSLATTPFDDDAAHDAPRRGRATAPASTDRTMAPPRKSARGATSLTTAPDTAAVVKAMRDVLGLSQERFAAKVGLKQQQISAYETGLHAINLLTLAEMADKAGVRLEVTVRLPDGSGK